MIELPISAIAGTARMALQVASRYRRPALEIYATLRNRIGPERVWRSHHQFIPEELREHRTRDQNVFVEFILANIGGKRAESVSLSLEGDFPIFYGQQRLSQIGLFSGAIIPQMAPAQVFPLFQIDADDLFETDEGGKTAARDDFSIIIDYDAPTSFSNRAFGAIRRLRKKRQYRTRFAFSPAVYRDMVLPAPEYAG